VGLAALDPPYSLKPTAEGFETGQVKLLKDGDIRVPGV
jgi:hypothetical protein